MDVGVTDAACMHLHQHLIGAGLRLRNFFDLPRTVHRGNDRSLHNTSSLAKFDASAIESGAMILNARQSDTQAEIDDHLGELSVIRKFAINGLVIIDVSTSNRPHFPHLL